MEYRIKSDTFELADIFECGQCFRWNKEENGSYTGVFHKNVLNVDKKDDEVIFKGICEGNIEKICIWETIISFIISANNNIPRIKGIIERLSKAYGDKIEYEGKEYYTFPTPEQLKNVTVQDFRNLGLGFRDIRLYETTHMILDKEVDLNGLSKMPTKKAREELLRLSGVGPKVADCILLFSTLKRFDVFPIDVWVRRVMNELYIKNADENKVTKNEIQKLANEKFGNLELIRA